ncbi:MAG: GntR family transcriptional regulator [Microbacteriaceae bacterium]|nr:GntR family transcriptional regulator [Microbacteriaceae bacterium]
MRAGDRAYLTLREEILEGTLAAGIVLGEVEQSLRLGVSRTPLREALTRLTSDRLIAAHTGRGLIVTEIDETRIRELFEVRQALEEQSARLAARRRVPGEFEALRQEFRMADDLVTAPDPGRRRYYDLVARLDGAVDRAAGNPFLATTLDSVRTHVARIRRLAADNPERLREAAREHLLIVDAIVEGSESLAAHATQLHLYRSLNSILATIAAPAPAPSSQGTP